MRLTMQTHYIHHNRTPAIGMPKTSPRPDQKQMPTFPRDELPAPVKTCPIYVALLPVTVAALEVVVVVLVAELPGSVPPIPLQIIPPTFACVVVVDVVVGVALATPLMVVIASVIVELPTTRNALLGARLTGVSRIVTPELPGVSVVPAMTIGLFGRTTTGRL